MRQTLTIKTAAVILGVTVIGAAGSAKNPVLPQPCAPGACGPAGSTPFVTAGAAGAVASGNTLTVNQTTNSAILNWSSFNIGAGGTVNFKQPGTSSIALNRIFQASPSQIFGSLNANGQVYLLNLNGFLFGPTATVNVGGLLVSSLPLTLSDANFHNGILSPAAQDSPVFDATCAGCDPLAPGGRTSVLDANGNPVLDVNGSPLMVQVLVQPGAQLAAADQGRLLLAGQRVTNGGTLTAPDGQIILAAGSKVFLQADTDPSLRGLIVEVDADKTNVAWNQLTGTLSSPRGNITMVGLAVNQEGRISATTSVAANGSIRLEAAGGANFVGSDKLVSTVGGALTIGPKSDMEILPELASGAAAVSAQTQLQSSVTLLGEQVILQGGSIDAPGGTLTAIAAASPSAATVPLSPSIPVSSSNPMLGVPSGTDSNARLRIDSGTSIDLAGSFASLPASANLVQAQLRSSELADDPNQRNGALHGQTVYVDARLPSPPIANLAADIATVPQSIAQRTEAGGSAVLQSQGDVVFAAGANINVSGGSTTYSGGVLQTSYLVGADGKLYPIATANPLLTYVGVVNPTFSQVYNTWGVKDVLPTPGLSTYQPGYVQGAPAGSVQFAAPTLVLQGTLQGGAVNGLYQRTPATAVSGGQLTIGIPLGAGAGLTSPLDYVAPAVRLSTASSPFVIADDAALPGSLTLDLPVSYLTGSGFTSTQIYSNYGVTLPAATPLELPPGSTLSVNAARVDLLSSIIDPAGTLSFQNVLNVGSSSPTSRPGVYVGDGVTLDVRGLFTNDMPVALAGAIAAAPVWKDAGSINLSVATAGGLLSLGNDDSLRASGGAWIQAGGAVAGGTGGKIALGANAYQAGIDVGANLGVDGFGVNGAAGGSFSLAAPRLDIGAAGANWLGPQQVDDTIKPGGMLRVSADLFSDYGFEKFSLNAYGLVVPTAVNADVLLVEPGTAIDTTVRTLYLNPGANLKPSAANLDGLAGAITQAPYLRQSAGVSLGALPSPDASNTAQNGATSLGDIEIAKGASISTGAGGSISLAGKDSIIVDGVLRSPGGSVSINLQRPGDLFEVGFLPTQRIELGSTGVIDVSGTFVSQPSTLGLSLGTLYGGGSVQLLADRGAVVTDSGSLISIAGTSSALDVRQPNGSYGHGTASSAGGSITVHSGESIALVGAIDAAAGATGTSGPAAAGSLDLALTRSESWWGVIGPAATASFNQSPLTVELVPSTTQTAPVTSGDNLAMLGTTQLAQSGFDSVRIEAGDVAQFSGSQFGGGVSLALGRQLVIDAPAIAAVNGARVSLNAPYLEVGHDSTLVNSNPPPQATGGSGTMTLSGNEIDLLGASVFQGTSDVTLSSLGDLKLRGEPTGTGLPSLQGLVTTPGTLQGSLSVAGNITLDAARIYPLTTTSFVIDATEPATGTASSVTFGQTAVNPGTPLSAGGALSIEADTIASTGTVYVPFGTLSLNAAKSLTLGDGSLTSVSGGGLTIPYGQTRLGGTQWIYETTTEIVNGVPARLVSLNSPSITMTKQATVDLSGGGALQAFEWVPGAGGTLDKLTGTVGSGYVPGLYAVLPSTLGRASPQDPQNTLGSSIQPGESVYLTGGGGLAAGFYPLLPARYALEPGAFLIQVEPTFQSTAPGSLGSLADGTPVVAGYLSYGSTGLHQTPGYTGFAVYPGSYASRLAQYDLHSASDYFSAVATAAGAVRPTMPADAGTFAITVPSAAVNATTALNLAGQVITTAGSGGLAAPIEISANDLVVGTPAGAVPSDAVNISGGVIASWQPGSLLLGGIASPTSNAAATGGSAAAGSTAATPGTTIDVLSNTVTVGAGTTLSAGEITLVANQSIDVQSGATLQSTSAASGTAPAATPAMQQVTLTTSGTMSSTGLPATPALLAVSDLNWLIPLRGGNSAAAGAATVALDAGSVLASRGSLSIDGLGGVMLNGTLSGTGAEWSLGSSSMAIVPTGVHADALSLNPALIGQLNAAGAVRLASTGALDLLTSTALGVTSSGTPTLDSLTLAANTLNNQSGTAGASSPPAAEQFGAKTLTLEGAGGTPAPATAGFTGDLSLYAGELDIGPNTLAVTGFSATHAVVSGAVVGRGVGALSVGGDLSLATTGITVAPAAQTSIGAAGALSVTPAAAGGAGKLPGLLGGALTLSGASVDIAGTVTAPSGIVNIVSAGAVTIDSGATVSAAGNPVSIQNQTVGAPGGAIAINAGTNLAARAGVTLDVSGAGVGGGGALSLSAGNVAALGATLKGNGGAGGSFAIDAGSLSGGSGAAGGATPLDLLASSLGAGGFSQSITVRTRGGDLALDAGHSLAANEVSLTADQGQLNIAGTITADSGALRGTISLYGGAGVTVDGALHADGVTSGRGGSIEIGAGRLTTDTNGLLDQYNGATIQLAGSQISAAGTAGNGTLLLRAPALTASNDVAIGTLATTALTGVAEVIVEPVLPYDTANTAFFSSPAAPTATDFQQVLQNVTTFMTASGPNIAGRLAPNGAPLMVEPGVEIIASDPKQGLTLQSADGVSPALDLSSWRFNGAPVDLTVRSAGNLVVANSVTDGFGSAPAGGPAGPILLAGPSSSIRLVAGADLGGANPLAAVSGGNGSLSLGLAGASAAPAVVRTGTGDIDLVAAQNILLGNQGSGAYTAGTPAVAPGGTSDDPYPASPAGTSLPFGIVPARNLLMSFPTGGGALRVAAGGDVVGVPLTTAAVPAWQLREGGSKFATPAWGVNLAAYDWSFGTLGGGDLQIAAGHDIRTVTAAAADSLLPQYGGATQYVTGGGLSLAAGNDVASAEVFLADGVGSIRAGGGLTPVLTSLSQVPGDPNVGSGFYLQSSTLNVTARLGIAVDGVFNPTSMSQSIAQRLPKSPLPGAYFSYSDGSSLNLLSVADDIDLGAAQGSLQTLLGQGQSTTFLGAGIFPGTFSAEALGGTISLGPGIGRNGLISLYPSPQGQLTLLAAKDISGLDGEIMMSDAVPGSYATVATPLGQTAVGGADFIGNIHATDTAPALVTAGGNISHLGLSIPKAAQIVAGEDLVELRYQGENLNSTDLTLLSAGRDVTFTQQGSLVSVGGPGQLDVLAGRNVSLGLSRGGIITTGNLVNPNLPSSQGADLTIATGLGTQPDFSGFVTKIVAPSPAYQAALVDQVESLQGSAGLTFAAAESAFAGLTRAQQQPLIDQVFFSELSKSGIAANTVPNAGFAEGYAAIDALYPGSRTGTSGAVAESYAGDLTLAFSRIYTLSGGNIDLLVPGGLINVGLANPPSTLASRAPSTLGIVAEGPGNVDIYSKGDVNVNASRIFTLGGGNILIWSDEGSIDAGRGAKTAVSAPPPTVLINSDGSVSINFAGAAAGSGIRTIQTDPSQPLGNVDLIAPVGTVNAGDAGIGSAGNINIAAASVIGVSNINFGGAATGVPAQISSVGASLAGASAASSGASNTSTSAVAGNAAEKAAAAPLSEAALSWLDVFVTGLGEENCKPDDVECLKRQKTATR